MPSQCPFLNTIKPALKVASPELTQDIIEAKNENQGFHFN